MESEAYRSMDKNRQKHVSRHSRMDTNRPGVRALPIFKGYTVDVRLHEFRKVVPGRGLEIIDFRSPEGDSLLAEYLESIDTTTDEGKEILRYIV